MPRDLLAARKGRDLLEEQPSTAADVAFSIPTGLRNAVEGMAALPGLANEVGGNVAAWAANKLGVSSEAQETARNVGNFLTVFPGAPTQAEISSRTTPILGDYYEPKTMAGEYAQTGAEFLPAAISGPGGVARRVITQALLPAAASETAGQLTKGSDVEGYARIAGAVAGAMSPAAFKRMVSPLPISPTRKKMVDALARENVPMTAGQKTGRNPLLYRESELGGAKAANMLDEQGEAFTSAALKRSGISGNRALPEVMDEGLTTIGNQFDELAGRNSLIADKRLVKEIASPIKQYRELVPKAQQATVIDGFLDDLRVMLRGNQPLPGGWYQATRSRLERLARSSKGDPQLASALRGIREALDDGMERTLAITNKGDLGKWREVRRQYKNYLVLEKAAKGAGADTAMGIISPLQLRSAVAQQNPRAYVRGDGDFAELARAGTAILKPLPQSGTAPRLNARNLASIGPTIVGAGLGGAAGGTVGGLAGAAAGAATPWALGKALMSRPVQGYLANQAAAQMSTPDPRTAAIVAALLARQQAPAVSGP